MTRWDSILEYFRSGIAAISGWGTAVTDAVDPFGEDTAYPVANVYEGISTKNIEESSLGSDEWEREVKVGIITMNRDLESLKAQIGAIFPSDSTLGGLADIVTLKDIEKDVKFDPPSGAQAMTITYSVRYETPIGSE